MKGRTITSVRTSKGFLISSLIHLLFLVGKKSKRYEFIENALPVIKATFSIDDIIFMPKTITAGANNQLNIVSDTKRIMKIGDVSRIINDLERSSRLSPPFYIYIYSNTINPNILSQVRKTLGSVLWDEFHSYISKGGAHV
jgi:hypothetical protein